MIVWLLHNWKGYVRLRLHGYSPERFLNLCNARGLEVWELMCNRDGDYEFYMTVEGYRRHRAFRYSLFYLQVQEALVFRGGPGGVFSGAVCDVPVHMGYPV